jgi:hypothetical protein
MDWAFKAVVTALVIAALLTVARRFGRHAAGILTGLPTVTGPALIWLAVDRGEAYAVDAAIGSVAACAVCALFALAYERASRHAGPVVALTVASAAAVASAAPLPWIAGDLVAALALAVCASVAIHAALADRDEQRPSATPRVRGEPWLTAAVSGVVSGAVAWLAPAVDAFWAGVLASPPLIAAAVAINEHALREQSSVRAFLRGYVGGLIGRGGYGAVFALLLASAGTPTAAMLAALAGCVASYATMRALASHAAWRGAARRLP